MSDSHAKLILRHLKSGKSITALEALSKFGCMRLGTRIYDLKMIGHNITSKTIHDTKTDKRFSEYRMIGGKNGSI